MTYDRRPPTHHPISVRMLEDESMYVDLHSRIEYSQDFVQLLDRQLASVSESVYENAAAVYYFRRERVNVATELVYDAAGVIAAPENLFFSSLVLSSDVPLVVRGATSWSGAIHPESAYPLKVTYYVTEERLIVIRLSASAAMKVEQFGSANAVWQMFPGGNGLLPDLHSLACLYTEVGPHLDLEDILQQCQGLDRGIENLTVFDLEDYRENVLGEWLWPDTKRNLQLAVTRFEDSIPVATVKASKMWEESVNQ